MPPDLLLPRAPGDEDTQAGCKLLDSFAIVIQLSLAAIAFSTLIIKRQRENPQRPLRIWSLDVSKQVVGGIVIHSLNLLVSYISGTNESDPSNPCVWYFLNIFVDTTVGVGILWAILIGFKRLAHRLKLQGVDSGVYGDPPLINQLIKWVGRDSDFRHLSLPIYVWTMGTRVDYERLQAPSCICHVNFWVIDTIVKHNERQEISLGDQNEEDEIVNLLAGEDDTELDEHHADHTANFTSTSQEDLETNTTSRFKPTFAVDDDDLESGHDAWDDDFSFHSASPGNGDTAHHDHYELHNSQMKQP
ncbi:hypothetical protein NQZ79_g5388 [Umbelopsis isabellina]|nr:hypothetical protein NQZ79_g5388 [Umbelopsis isabellina]